MSTERDAADRLLDELRKGAARADAAERELADLRKRMEVFTFEIPPPEYPEPYATRIMEEMAARRIGAALIAHHVGNRYHERGSAVQRLDIDEPRGRVRRYSVRIVLELEDFSVMAGEQA